MYRDNIIAVVIPAYNEEKLLERTVDSLPDFVDRVAIIDDCSVDGTRDIIIRLAEADSRIHGIYHDKNMGNGAARASGFKWCVQQEFDIVVTVDADNQMDPDDMPALLDPIVDDTADFTKGNRLVTGEAWQKIPHIRYLGNSALTFMTKIASGYWHVTDSQCGYTAARLDVYKTIPLDEIYSDYGVFNDLLVTLNIYNFRVMDININPIYGVGEKSGMRLSKVLFKMPFLMIRLFIRRMIQRYIIRDFHPLIFFYAFGFILMALDVPLIARLFYYWNITGSIPKINALAILFCTFMGMQSILFAMLFDMEANRELKG